MQDSSSIHYNMMQINSGVSDKETSFINDVIQSIGCHLLHLISC